MSGGGGATRFLLFLTTTPAPLLHHRCPSLLRLSRHRHHSVPPCLRSLYHRHHFHHRPSTGFPTVAHSLKPKAANQELHTKTAGDAASIAGSSSLPSPVYHPWPEWSNLIQNLYYAGYFNRPERSLDIDGLVASSSGLPEDFRRAAAACLAFSRDRPGILGMLSRRDIEVMVANGTPFLFENADDSVRRMRLFLGGGDSSVPSSDILNTVDLMRFILSYASNLVSPEKSNLWNRELVEPCVQNLLSELVQLSHNVPQASMVGLVQNPNQFPDMYGQAQRPAVQNVEMKRGDWICPRCNFMNFARNVKCRECEEPRPKRQLTGREWECPQCDFFNYGRNTVCLRCDCKWPGETLVTANSSSGLAYGNLSYPNSAGLDSRLAANEEKAQRWFSKISQMDSTSKLESDIADEDFPEIMPLRKGVNRFVVSTRKTPLERRLANAQYRRNFVDASSLEGTDIQRMDDDETTQKMSERFEQVSFGQSAGTNIVSISNSASPKNGTTQGSSSKHVSFVPLPADMFANKSVHLQADESQINRDTDISASSSGEQKSAVSGSNELQPSEKPISQALSDDKEKERAEKSERWFKKVAELHNVTDLTSAISDEDFPEIMPMRKGENRFVVSKKKDRSLTSPTYKRRIAMEQANNTNYVPFVPFPPDYFAKKDKQQPNGADSTNRTLGEYSNSTSPDTLSENVDAARTRVPSAANVQEMGHQQQSVESWSYRNSKEDSNERKTDVSYGMAASEMSPQIVVDPQPSSSGSWSSEATSPQNIGAGTNPMRNPVQSVTDPQDGEDNRSSEHFWKQRATEAENKNQNSSNRWSGKSLEGSAVEEPDPLDMSEEAKAERWFRRVAQIKDISELSQIPDEDFPSIMPMRKGVNRFVVSKRKTPLERRLASTRYRRNLPVGGSDALKENDSS